MASSDYKLKKIPIEKMFTHNDSPMRMPPNFYVNSAQMPEIKDWKVGGKYKLIIEVEQKSLNETEETLDASLEIQKYKVLVEKDIDDMSDKEFGEYQGKVMSGE